MCVGRRFLPMFVFLDLKFECGSLTSQRGLGSVNESPICEKIWSTSLPRRRFNRLYSSLFILSNATSRVLKYSSELWSNMFPADTSSL